MGGKSTLLTFPLKDSRQRFGSASGDMQFASAVASFGMLLRNSKFKGQCSYAAVLETAAAARGEDKHQLRAEFLRLVEAAKRLSGEPVGMAPLWLPSQRTALVCGTVEPSPAGEFAASLRNWWSSLPIEHVFLLGILAGVAAAIGALVVGVRLAHWRARLATEPAISNKIAGRKLAPRVAWTDSHR
jgi:hypothetical protein